MRPSWLKNLRKPTPRRNRRLPFGESATGVERMLVEAMARRCPSNRPAADFTAWTDDYAAAMRDVHGAYPDDPDVSALFADALMCRTPWKLWDLKSGEARPGASTLEAREVLEQAMAERRRRGEPGHAGQLHFYIHLMEMSPTPEAALRAGDELHTLAADCGHLHHMPTHIDFQCGQYHDVVARNSEAILADRKFLEREGPLNMFSYSRIHNIHFKLYGAMFLGHYGSAMAAVTEFEETVPEALIRIESPPMADLLEGYYGLKPHALIRFGRWREILDEPLPSDSGALPGHHCGRPLRAHRRVRGPGGRDPRREGEGPLRCRCGARAADAHAVQ